VNARAEQLDFAGEQLPEIQPSASELTYISLQVAVREFELRFGRRIRFKRSLAAVISRQFLQSTNYEEAEETLRRALLANGLRLRTVDHCELVVER
jgi:hypothetical protein